MCSCVGMRQKCSRASTVKMYEESSISLRIKMLSVSWVPHRSITYCEFLQRNSARKRHSQHKRCIPGRCYSTFHCVSVVLRLRGRQYYFRKSPLFWMPDISRQRRSADPAERNARQWHSGNDFRIQICHRRQPLVSPHGYPTICESDKSCQMSIPASMFLRPHKGNFPKTSRTKSGSCTYRAQQRRWITLRGNPLPPPLSPKPV